MRKFSPLEKAAILIALFVVARAIVTPIWEGVVGYQAAVAPWNLFEVSPRFLLFITAVFVVGSLGIVYLGLTRWAKVSMAEVGWRKEKCSEISLLACWG